MKCKNIRKELTLIIVTMMATFVLSSLIFVPLYTSRNEVIIYYEYDSIAEEALEYINFDVTCLYKQTSSLDIRVWNTTFMNVIYISHSIFGSYNETELYWNLSISLDHNIMNIFKFSDYEDIDIEDIQIILTVYTGHNDDFDVHSVGWITVKTPYNISLNGTNRIGILFPIGLE